MIYLLFATLCSASIALVFKFSETRGLNRDAVTTVNYFIATLVSLTLTIINGVFFFDKWILIIGIPAGLFFYLAFVYYQKSVNDDGAGLAGMFGKLGILMPMILSLTFWREWPTSMQWIGIGFSMMAIVLVNWNPNMKNIGWRPALMLLFLFGGMAEFSNKLYQRFGSVELKSLFLAVVFGVAFCFSLSGLLKRKLPIRKIDFITGICVGVPNLFSSLFLILALQYLPTAVVFPAYSAGAILTIFLLSHLIFKEKMTNRAWVSAVLTLIGLVFIQV